MQITIKKIHKATDSVTTSTRYFESAAKAREYLHMGASALRGSRDYTILCYLPEKLIYETASYRYSFTLG